MKIALVQSTLAWGDEKENLKNFDNKLAKCTGCDIIILPEMFISGCMMIKQESRVAIAAKNRTASFYEEVKHTMSGWAVRQQALVMGSTVYEESGKYYNRLIAAFPDGLFRYYDKRHCFRMGGENEHFTGGNVRQVFEFRGVKIAVFICYDLRFPVWSRNVEEYDLAVYVANWPESRRTIWQTLLKARAIENQAFVAGVNCVGRDNNGLTYAGDSVLVNARGEVTGACEEFEEQTVMAEADINDLHNFRRKFSVLNDRDNFDILICRDN